jgi:hypothetical protein
MSERLPYEQHLHQQWTEVPLPDENMAWADMKRRLEEDDDDGFFFWWRPGCGIVGLLLVLLGLGWWLLRNKEGKEKKEMKEVVYVDSLGKKRSGNAVDTSLVNMNASGSKIKDSERTQENAIEENKKNEIAGNPEKQTETENDNKNERSVKLTKKATEEIKGNPTTRRPVGTKKEQRPKPKNITPVSARQKDIKENDVAVKKPTGNEITDAAAIETPKTDSTVSATKKTDSAGKKAVDSPAAKKPNQPDSSKPKSFFFSAGLSIQQQLPIAGQKASPYNSLGRKGSWQDYIPSVYVRLNRKDKWFLQAEFKYGAPQYTKEFLYHQTIVPDTGVVPRFEISTSNSLKKSFYHQLPFTFNYYVKPNWSVGGGLQWNKFYGAVSDQEVIKHDNITNTDQVLSKGIAVTKTDSTGSFEKSYFQGVFETQYRWKRFSFGARYTFGLQPYITVSLPNQPDRKEKNSNILIFMRYELWRQKK